MRHDQSADRRFAEEVLASMRLDDAEVWLSRPEHLRHLPDLGPIASLQFSGDYSGEELGAALDKRVLRELLVAANSRLTDVEFLRDHPEIDSLTLSVCHSLRDMSALSALPLTALNLYAHELPREALGILTGLPRLSTLSLDLTPLDGRLPEPLGHVTELNLSSRGRGIHLQGIGSWTSLHRLFVQDSWADLAPLGQLRSLPHLTDLGLWENTLDDLVDVPPLPSIRTATLILNRPIIKLPVERLFPGLREVFVWDQTFRAGALDLRALHSLPDLQVTVHGIATPPRVMDADRFGDRLIVRFTNLA
ncbi:hypothetical protein I5Q34_11900 [Streptomyces sp. AV19]|uniref:hypothetical protein n=1 Tax=Streptomyces sp. AV19 TaxID=2793068 RepID=UPI0018FED1F8|nr:hypothetical protein [Streptomyces sp. AV19]MBH1934969.1 hypothetical protein [Streptomyces sp. AV19]MDG4534575.1 hypothetical protein [Streptomyces sp. AV19]